MDQKNETSWVSYVFLLGVVGAFMWMSLPFIEPAIFALALCSSVWPIRACARRVMGRRFSSLALAGFLSLGLGIPACSAWNYSVTQLDLLLSQPISEKLNEDNLFTNFKIKGLVSLKKMKTNPSWQMKVQSAKNLPWGELGLVAILVYFMLADAELGSKWVLENVSRGGPSWSNAYSHAVVVFIQTVKSCVWFGGGSAIILWVLYFWAKAPSPLAFAVATAVASMFPFIAPIMVTTVGFSLLSQDNMVGPVALILIGALGLGFINNVLRPKWIGDKTGLILPIALLGMAGGAMAWGATGLLIGPSIITVLLKLINVTK